MQHRRLLAATLDCAFAGYSTVRCLQSKKNVLVSAPGIRRSHDYFFSAAQCV